MSVLGKMGLQTPSFLEESQPEPPKPPGRSPPDAPEEEPRECSCGSPSWWEDQNKNLSCTDCSPPLLLATLSRVWLAYYDEDPNLRYWKPWATTYWNPFLIPSSKPKENSHADENW
jgi:hypothetical protein